MRRMSTVFLGVGLCLLALGGCESTGDGGTGGTPRSGPAPAKATTARARYETRKMGTGAEFSAGEKAKMGAAWQAYLDHSPAWPELREGWIGIGPAATDILVDNLLRALFVAMLTNRPEEVDRARYELIRLGDRAVPTVTGILLEPSYRDPDTGEERRLSTDLASELVNLLLVARAEAPLEDLVDSEAPSIRRAALDALGQIGEERGIAAVLRVLTRSGDWIDRVAAAKALKYGHDPRATKALLDALTDSEDMVAIEAARSLAIRGDVEAAPRLDALREEARAKGNHRLAAAFGAAAKAIREKP